MGLEARQSGHRQVQQTQRSPSLETFLSHPFPSLLLKVLHIYPSCHPPPHFHKNFLHISYRVDTGPGPRSDEKRQPSWSRENKNVEEGRAWHFSQALIPGYKSAVRNLKEALVQVSHIQKSMWDRQVTEVRQTRYKVQNEEC